MSARARLHSYPSPHSHKKFLCLSLLALLVNGSLLVPSPLLPLCPPIPNSATSPLPSVLHVQLLLCYPPLI